MSDIYFTSWTNKNYKRNSRDLLRRVYVNDITLRAKGLKAYLSENLNSDAYTVCVTDMHGARKMGGISDTHEQNISEHMEEIGINDETFEELFTRFDKQATDTYGE